MQILPDTLSKSRVIHVLQNNQLSRVVHSSVLTKDMLPRSFNCFFKVIPLKALLLDWAI